MPSSAIPGVVDTSQNRTVHAESSKTVGRVVTRSQTVGQTRQLPFDEEIEQKGHNTRSKKRKLVRKGEEPGEELNNTQANKLSQRKVRETSKRKKAQESEAETSLCIADDEETQQQEQLETPSTKPRKDISSDESSLSESDEQQGQHPEKHHPSSEAERPGHEAEGAEALLGLAQSAAMLQSSSAPSPSGSEAPLGQLIPPPLLPMLPALPATSIPTGPKMWKRCATHVATAYYIFYQQRHQLLQSLTPENAWYAQKFLLPISLDPTFEATVYRERRKLMMTASKPAPSQQTPPSPQPTPNLVHPAALTSRLPAPLSSTVGKPILPRQNQLYPAQREMAALLQMQKNQLAYPYSTLSMYPQALSSLQYRFHPSSGASAPSSLSPGSLGPMLHQPTPGSGLSSFSLNAPQIPHQDSLPVPHYPSQISRGVRAQSTLVQPLLPNTIAPLGSAPVQFSEQSPSLGGRDPKSPNTLPVPNSRSSSASQGETSPRPKGKESTINFTRVVIPAAPAGPSVPRPQKILFHEVSTQSSMQKLAESKHAKTNKAQTTTTPGVKQKETGTSTTNSRGGDNVGNGGADNIHET